MSEIMSEERGGEGFGQQRAKEECRGKKWRNTARGRREIENEHRTKRADSGRRRRRYLTSTVPSYKQSLFANPT